MNSFAFSYGNIITTLQRYIIFFIFLLTAMPLSALQLQFQSVPGDTIRPDSLRVDSLGTDTTGILSLDDSLQTKVIVDTQKVLFHRLLSKESTVITKEEINFSDYRNPGEIFNLFPLSYIRSLGYIGMPDDLLLYGQGYGNISWFEDGVLLTDRIKNSFTTLNIQVENTGKVELLPLSRGFLYGTLNNPVAVNMQTQDYINPVSYSRIKYYEGTDGEGLLDVRLSSMPFNKLAFTMDITNKKVDDGYTNTDFTTWKARFKIKYLLSNQFNITAKYYFNRVEYGLNGGINIEELGVPFDEIEFGSIKAEPVVFDRRMRKYFQHNVSVSLLSTLLNGNETMLTVYYQSDEDEFSGFYPDSTIQLVTEQRNSNLESLHDNYQTIYFDKRFRYDRTYDLYGLTFRQDFQLGPFDLQAMSTYEHLERNSVTESSTPMDNFSAAGILTTNLFGGGVRPSFYAKTATIDGTVYAGSGADLSITLSDSLTFFAGISTFGTKDILVPEIDEKIITTAESKLTYGHDFYAAVSVFFKSTQNQNLKAYENLSSINGYNSLERVYEPENELYGASLVFNYNYWKLYLETQTSWYHQKVKSFDTYAIPQFVLRYNLLYKDTLFSENLNLETGFTFSLSSSQSYFFYDFYNARIFYDPENPEIETNYRLDFNLAGRIRQAVILYFSWRNLLDRSYYLTPYYPTLGRNIRFGVAWEFFN